MLHRKSIIGTLIVVGVFWAIAALSPTTSLRHWQSIQESASISQATFLPMSDLPFRVLRAPAMQRSVLEKDFRFTQKIELNQFFGFDLKTMPEKDQFQLVLEDKVYTVRLKSLEKKGEDYYTWIGALDSNDNHLFVMTYLKGYAGANINGPSGVYAIHYEHGHHLLKKLGQPE